MGTFRYIGTDVLTARGRSAVKQAVTDAAEDLVGQAQARTPVLTGTLKASIHVASVSGQGSNASVATYTATVATGGESSEYAIFRHEGTYKMSGVAFLGDALIENRAVYLEAMARAARGAY